MVLLLETVNLHDYFGKITDTLEISQEPTRAYIINIFTSYAKNTNILSNESITIRYAIAKNKYDFESFQIIGDWLFFSRSLFPENLAASAEYYDTIARSSYYRCYKILDKKWPLFEELADRFPIFVSAIQQADLSIVI